MKARKKEKIFILDASALINARQLGKYIGLGQLVTTESVFSELRDYLTAARFEILKEGRFVTLCLPSPNSLSMVKKAAQETGSLENLSLTDLDVLGLALDLKDNNPTIISDDHEIQNIAALLNLSYQPSPNGKRIKSIIIWKFVCLSCGHSFLSETKICPDCGGVIKRKIKSRKKHKS